MFFKKKGKSSNPPGPGKRAPTPKYSQRTAGTQTRKYSGPRYSQSSARSLFRNIKISPKYSTVSVGSARGSGAPYPRYSQPVNWKGTKFAGMLRYSKPNNWKGAYFPGVPRYTSFKHRFYVHKRYKEQTRPYTPWLDVYSGDTKYKRPKHKNMHPSVNYLKAKNITSKNIKKGLRKWSVFWVQLNPRKISPKGLRNVAKKPKFDKKEKDIWNNGREKKPTTRNDVTQGSAETDGSAENKENNQ